MATASFIYLASQSPRRSQLLDLLGVAHQPLLPAPDEDAEGLEAVQPGEEPKAYVQRVTQAKLDAALKRLRARGLPAAPILCADTTVALGRRILGKPANADEALAMLMALSGKRHHVHTAVVVGSERKRVALLSSSTVEFDAVEAHHWRAYVRSGEPMGKAGAYAIQGCAAQWVKRINGSYTGIMGLPLRETAQALAAWKVPCAPYTDA